jgi:hypothetical protein
MTIDEFIEALGETRDMGWGRVGLGLSLRAYPGNELCSTFCPITAVAFTRLGITRPTVFWEDAADDLRLKPNDAARIAEAADHGGHDKGACMSSCIYAEIGVVALRARLLEAVGLE